jgi:hypothetical protein
MKPIPLFGVGVKSHSSEITSQRRLNCFYDIRVDQDKEKIVIVGTPGSTLEVSLPKAPIRGWRYIRDQLYVVAGDTLYMVYLDGSYYVLGTLSTHDGYVCMTDNNNQILIVDGLKGYIYTLLSGTYVQTALNSSGSFAAITDANFPQYCTSVDFLDGRFVAVKPFTRQFYISDSYDGTSWTWNSGSAVWDSKENNSDYLVAVVVINGLLILLGEQTTEFWQDVGTSPSPYARINGTTQNWGVAAQYSVAQSPDSILLLAQNREGGLRVIRLVSNTANQVSTDDIETIIEGMKVIGTAVGLTYYSLGHQFYQLTFPDENRSFLYDVTTGLWSETQTGIGITGMHYGRLGIAAYGVNLISDQATGNIYRVDFKNYTDNDQYIPRQIISRHVHFGQNEASVASICLDMETGVGNNTGLGVDPQLVMQVSKDGGKTFGIEKPVSLGTKGSYRKKRALWRRLGKSNDFVFKFTLTDPVQFVILSAVANIGGGNQVGKNE